jgi:hypothetical protein
LDALALYRIVQTAEGNDLAKAHAWEAFYNAEWEAAHHHIDEEKVNPESPEATFTVVAEDAPPAKPPSHRNRQRNTSRPANEHRRPHAKKPADHPSTPLPSEFGGE